MTETVLQICGLTAGYPGTSRRDAVDVVRNVSETLRAGELICLVGPNGAGKSTLLRTLAGMQPALAGTVSLLGENIRAMRADDRARKLSLVLTSRIDAGYLTGYALVALGRSPYTGWMGQLNETDHAIVREAIALVGAQSLSQRVFSTLSDGERQKLLIARALAQQPRLMILDEPTAFLDQPRRVECMGLLRDLAHRTRCAVLLSTHDLDLALRYADRIWLLPYGGGLRAGVPEDLVLNGAFETAFENMGVQFDLHTGTFQKAQRPVRQIVLMGAGTGYFWTKRALERQGYHVLGEAVPGMRRVHIEDRDTGECWLLDDDESRACTSVGQLLELLSNTDRIL